MKKHIEVIVVDDKQMITDLFSSYINLFTENATVHAFNNACDAMDYLKSSQKVDIIITDYKMPGINGIELLEASPPSATKIMISGYVSDIAQERLSELNALFFEKPVPMKEIGRVISARIE